MEENVELINGTQLLHYILDDQKLKDYFISDEKTKKKTTNNSCIFSNAMFKFTKNEASIKQNKKTRMFFN